LSEQAQRFYRSGRPFLRNYLPFWVATFVDRMAVLLIPGLALLIPLFGLSPWIYTWRNRSRIYRWYADLLAAETRFRAEPTPEQVRDCQVTLDRVEAGLGQVRVSLAFANEIYTLREHVAMVRRSLATIPAAGAAANGPRPPG
jgi:hypothetical protein